MRILAIFLISSFAYAQVTTAPSIAGAMNSSGFGGGSQISSGSWIEIYGSNLANRELGWSDADFVDGFAPTLLDGVSVAVDGRLAYIAYVSPAQVNALLPSGFDPGPHQLVVLNHGTASPPYQIVGTQKPALFAPSFLKSGGLQFVGATFPDFQTWVANPGLFPGIAAKVASPGDTIILWGIGFGPVTPDIPVGKVAWQLTQLLAPVTVTFDQQPARVLYAGLAPGCAGLYQFNVVVPEILTAGSATVSVRLGGPLGPAAEGLIAVAAPNSPQITGMTPRNAYVGDEVTFSTSGLATGNVAVSFERLDGSTVAVTAFLSDGSVSAKVPYGAVDGRVYIESSGTNSPALRTQPFWAAISPRIRLRPRSSEVAAGEDTVVDAVFLFDTRQRALKWDASVGTIDGDGRFRAPGDVNNAVFARVQACLADRQICSTAVIQVTPFRVEPAQPVVPVGGSVKLTAYANGTEAAVTWSAVSANITIDTTGNVRAGTGTLDGGVARVKAVARAGVERIIDVAVIGVQSGMTAVIREFSDWFTLTSYPYASVPVGVFARGVVTMGDRAYVLAQSYSWGNHFTGSEAMWLDSYDIADPANARWLGSTGVPVFNGGLAHLAKLDGRLAVTGGACFVFDLADGLPVLMGQRTDYGSCEQLPAGPQPRPNSDWAYAVGSVSGYDGVCRRHIAALSPLECFAIPAAPGVDYTYRNSLVVGDSRRAYLAYTEPDQNGGTYSGKIYVYDMTVRPPTMVGSADIQNNRTLLTLRYHSLTQMGNLLLCGTQIYELDGDTPKFVSDIAIYSVEDFDLATHRVLGMGTGGMQVADLTDPRSPRVSAGSTALRLTPSEGLALTKGDAFLVANGELEINSVTWSPGPVFVRSMGGMAMATDIKTRGNLAFVAETRNSGPGTLPRNVRILQVYELNEGVPHLVGYYEDGTRDGLALEISNDRAFLLCESSLLVLDVSNPASPSLLATVPVGGSSIVLAGASAFISTLHDGNPVLVAMDVSNPAAPAILGETSLNQSAYSLALNGTILAVGGSSWLGLYDVSNPRAPAKLWESADGIPAWGVAWSGNLVYAAGGSTGLVVRDASTPRAPVVIGINGLKDFDRVDTLHEFANQPLALSVHVDGPILYVGTTNSYATVFGLDVRDPRTPRIVYIGRYGNTLLDQVILTFGSIANWMLMGGGGYPLDAVGIYDVSSPGNVIRPVPVQTQPGYILPLLF